MGQNAEAPSPAPKTDADCGDADLLRRYVRHESQAAFAELVRRYGGLVHATCVREVDDPHLAEDATQVVFLLLARKAPSLLRVDSLAGWLFRAARFSARNALRHERRRKVHEQAVIEDMTQAHLNGPPIPSWSLLEPLLNAALASLRPHEQEVVLLRYLEGRSWRETATQLGLAEDAAQKRGTRAVDKMRRFVNQQGLVLSLAALTALLSEEAARAAPLPAALTQTAGAITGQGFSSPNVNSLYQGVLHTMKMTKIAAALGGLALTGTVGGLIWAQSMPKPGSPQALLTQVRAHYQGLSSFSMQVTHQDSLAATPVKYTQVLQWHQGGRFEMHNTPAAGATRPDIYADGGHVVSVFPNGQRNTESLTVPPNTMPQWPVQGGQILQWLQAVPLNEMFFRPQLGITLTWQFGPRTSWHGQKVRELRATLRIGRQTAQTSFFVDEAAQTLVGDEFIQPDGIKMDTFYTNQKENPPLPATLGSAP